MTSLLLATMLFISIPTITNEPTVYSEPVSEVSVVEDDTLCTEYDAPTVYVAESVTEVVDYSDTIEDMPCTHGSFTDIIYLGDGIYEGFCECGESIRWCVEEIEDEPSEDEDNLYDCEDEDHECEWMEYDDYLECSICGIHATVEDWEEDEDGD